MPISSRRCWFCLCLLGFGFICFALSTPRALTRSLLRAISQSSAEQFEYVCECNERFEIQKTLQSHIAKSGHFNGTFNGEVANKCKQAVVGMTITLAQNAGPVADRQLKYICECNERFVNERSLQSHIAKSGHFNGTFNGEVANKCKQAVVGMTIPLAQNAGPVADRQLKYICECNERFVNERSLQSHIAKSGHFNGMFTRKVAKKCKQAVVGMTATLTYKAGPAANNSSRSFVSTTAIKHSRECITVEDSAVRAEGTTALGRFEAKLSAYILGSSSEVESSQSGNALADTEHMPMFKESTLVGTLVGSSMREENQNQTLQISGTETQQQNQQQVFLNTHEPFCLVTVGVQGGGKSHTLATVLEGCLIPFPEHNLSRLVEPMTTLVLHYDESATTRCEVSLLYIISKIFDRQSL
jgi:predicted SprT family Zn-dependent metalloprotease